MNDNDEITIGLVSISDRASKGVYKDEGVPALEQWLTHAPLNPITFVTRVIPDEVPVVESTLKELGDKVPEDEKANVESALEALKTALEGDDADDNQQFHQGETRLPAMGCLD